MTETPPDERAFLSYAQNHEDVVLWRALGHVANGRYVDVGAADPVIDSVTAALYERGWRGIHVEPVPAYAAALLEARPGDVVVACGIGAEAGTRTLTLVADTGLSTFDSHAAGLARTRHAAVTELRVAVRTLDEVLSEHLVVGDDIHILKIDVEGLEAEVVAGAELGRWKPWVLVIESTEPNSSRQTHGAWEPMVEAAGYRFCLFDGLNRFYVHEDRDHLAAALSYPACPLDEPYEDRHAAERRRQLADCRSELERREEHIGELAADRQRLLSAHEELVSAHEELAVAHRSLAERSQQLTSDHEWLVQDHRRLGAAHDALVLSHGALGEEHRRLLADNHALAQAHAAVHAQLAGLQAAYDRLLSSVSWKVTAPLRSVRSRIGAPEVPISADAAPTTTRAGGPGSPSRRPAIDPETSFHRRLGQALPLLLGSDRGTPKGDGEDPIARYATALGSSGVDPMAAAWLSYVAATASYPDETTLRAEARLLRRLGPREYSDHLVELFDERVRDGRAAIDDLEPIVGGVAVDITHTAQHDLQTGIQRVVRETCSRWVRDERVVLAWWDYASNGLRRLPSRDVERFRDWRTQLAAASGEPKVHGLDPGTSGILVPWGSRLVLPELAAEPERTEGYRALSCSGAIDALGVIGYDIIPVTAAETVTEAMSHRFSLYLSMLKRSHRLAAISEAAAADFRGYNAALASQGLVGPVVEAHPLPPSPTAVDDASLASFRNKFGVGYHPLVLVVGSHEPRKNHITVLDAAERLWNDGARFVLLFIGGSGWRSEPFDHEVERLQSLGRPVQVSRAASEQELWAAYAIARFSVFPSLVEGYGLPIVESIASGTPVITTNYGSMAEVAAGGGAVLIDPYDAEMLADRMRHLLVDDEALERLRSEARSRRFPSWDDYAADVWRFLVEEG